VGPKPLASYGLNGQIQYMEFQGYSNYNSLQGRLEKRFSQGLSALTSFTWGKTLADATDQLASGGDATTYQGTKRTPQNGYDRRGEYGLADFDVKLRLAISAVWQVPLVGAALLDRPPAASPTWCLAAGTFRRSSFCRADCHSRLFNRSC